MASKRRLARAGRAHDRDELALADHEAHRSQGLDGDLARLVDLADLGELDDARAGVRLHQSPPASAGGLDGEVLARMQSVHDLDALVVREPELHLARGGLAIGADDLDGRVILVVMRDGVDSAPR